MERQRNLYSQNNFNKNKIARLILTDYKNFYNATLINKLRFWQKDSHIDQ